MYFEQKNRANFCVQKSFKVHGIKVWFRGNIVHVCMEGHGKNGIFDGSHFMGFSNQPYYNVCRMSSFKGV